jgi:hypothetical protein
MPHWRRGDGRYHSDMLVAAEAPNTADWMQGWGAIISLPLSLLAVLFTGWLLRHEIRVRREERTDLEARQARLVRVTIDERGLDEETATFRFTIRNLSPEPIYSIFVFSYSGGRYAIQGDEPVAWRLSAGDEIPISMGPNWMDTGDRFVPISPRAALQFEDANGRTWVRFEDEQPRRWIGPSMVSYQSNRALLAEYIGAFQPFRWLSQLRSNVWSAYRAGLERRIQAKKFHKK